VDADLGVPESTDSLVRPVSRGSFALVVLEHGGEEEKESDRGVDDALVGDVNVCQLFVHRFVQRYHQHNVAVRYEPERTWQQVNYANSLSK